MIYLDDDIKYSGEVRTIDDKWRIMLPRYVRQSLQLEKGDTFSVYTDGYWIHLKKDLIKCPICNSAGVPLMEFKEGVICYSCLKAIQEHDFDTEGELE